MSVFDIQKQTQSNTIGLASVPAVTQYLKAAEACGVDSIPLLERAGISAADLADNNKHISNAAMEHLLALLISASGDECFGLHSARFVEPASYSVLGYISMSCRTLREVQAKIPLFEKIVGDMGVTSIDIDGDFVFQRWQCHFSDSVVKRHEVEHVLASWATYSKTFLKFDAPASIWFEHSPPSDKSLLNDYSEIFGCEVLFNQIASGIRLPVALLDVPLPQGNDQLLQTLLSHATQLLAGLDKNQSITAKVENLLRLMLKKHSPSSALIAEKLGMSSRTLQRKLDEEGTNYKDVLTALRLELARYYLQSTSLTMDAIAFDLGYGETRSFHRSFKQWTGQTAGDYRKS